jgi:hypothetical protein
VDTLPNNTYRHDTIAETLGVPAASFHDMFQDTALGMKRLLMIYVKRLREMVENADGIPGSAPTASKTKTVILDGFPKLPQPFDVNLYSKKDLEDLYRDYIGAQYCACFHLGTAHRLTSV